MSVTHRKKPIERKFTRINFVLFSWTGSVVVHALHHIQHPAIAKYRKRNLNVERKEKKIVVISIKTYFMSFSIIPRPPKGMAKFLFLLKLVFAE